MSTLAGSLGRVLPAHAERRGDSPTARIGIAGRRATIVAHARAGDDRPDAPSPTRAAPEDSRWVEAPAPPASSVRDAPKKVRLRLRARAERDHEVSHNANKHPKISKLIELTPRDSRLEPGTADTRFPALTTSPPTQNASWVKRAKLAVAGITVAGSALVGARPANAVPDWAVNGGMATAGAAVAAAVIRGNRTSDRVDPTSIDAASATVMHAADVHAVNDLVKEMEVIRESEQDAGVVDDASASETEVLDKMALASLILAEMPLWQKALAAAVPSAAVLGLVLAARRWSHLERAKLAEASLTTEAKALSAALATVETKLGAIVEERDEAKKDFERWKGEMEADAEKRDALAAKKLEAAYKETKSVREELDAAKKKLERVGLSEQELASATRMNAELQKQLGEVQEANMRELELLHGQLDEARLDAKSELEKALKETESLRAKLTAAENEAAAMKTSLEHAGEELASTKAELEAAAAALARSRDVASAEAEALRAEAQRELENVVAEKHALEEWRAEREAWEEQTKSNFLDVEAELAAAKAALAAAESGSEEAAALAERLAESESALEAARAQAAAAVTDKEEADAALAEARSEYERVLAEAERSSSATAETEAALEKALADADALRKAVEEAESAVADSRATIAQLTDAKTQEESDVVRELKATHDAQIWEMETAMRALEDTMERTRDIARENAERMLRHNERMGRVVANAGYDEADIPVKFEIVVETVPGQRVAMVGTWNDWDVESAFPMRWTEGNLWTVTTPVHADDTYEYKYVVIDDVAGTTQWQAGNNRTLALQLSLHDDVVLVEVVDSWNPNPEAMPIMLHALDGSVKEVGSTQLLRECVRELRTEQAILDGSANLMVLEEIAGSLGGLALPAASDRSFKTPRRGDGKNGGDDGQAQIPDASFVDGAAATHATPAALAEAAAARAAKLAKKNPTNDASPETETESDFSPDGDVTVLQATDEATDETRLVSGDLDIASNAPRKGGVEADTGPR